MGGTLCAMKSLPSSTENFVSQSCPGLSCWALDSLAGEISGIPSGQGPLEPTG